MLLMYVIIFSDHLFITGGSSQGLVLLCNVFFQSGDPVFVPDLTGGSLDIFRDLGLNIVSGEQFLSQVPRCSYHGGIRI